MAPPANLLNLWRWLSVSTLASLAGLCVAWRQPFPIPKQALFLKLPTQSDDRRDSAGSAKPSRHCGLPPSPPYQIGCSPYPTQALGQGGQTDLMLPACPGWLPPATFPSYPVSDSGGRDPGGTDSDLEFACLGTVSMPLLGAVG